jgi:hypothetical protein
MEFPDYQSTRSEYLQIEAVGSHMAMDRAEILFSAGNNMLTINILQITISFTYNVNSFQDRKKKLNAGMMSLTIRGSNSNLVHEFGTSGSVIITFKHERKAKGPHYSRVNHGLYPGEKPTVIQGSAKCVYWNKLIGYMI